MALSDRTVGVLLQYSLWSLIGYCLVWTFLTPFLDKDHYLLGYFPSRTALVSLFALVTVTIVCGTMVFWGVILIQDARKRQ